MDYPDFIVCDFLENSIGLKMVKAVFFNRILFLNSDVIDVPLLTYSSKLSHLHFSADKGEVEEYDLAGLDETWQESDPEARTDSDEDGDSDVIPQLDGSVDEKPKGKL